MKVLVIEDEKKIASFIRKGLEAQGFAVELSHHGDEGLRMATTQPYDAVVLDIMLPGRDGLSILKSLRERRMDVPVLLLTARSEPYERVEGLNLGADDYLTKPFYIEELIARLHVVIRRASGTACSLLSVADLTVNLLTREVTRGSRKIELTAREFQLLDHLARVPGRVLTRAQICERVWSYDFDPGTNLVDVYIQRLRRKIDGAGEPAWALAWDPGVGNRSATPKSPSFKPHRPATDAGESADWERMIPSWSSG
ncbi:MAG: response regulator transcription factor [Akkermansiaceae bacterium]|nr:response regulator transcription factor [Akkermansiaceae bacterium]MCF7730426.1 response regulator transcription factor [Akkermansiaceae bacterium]